MQGDTILQKNVCVPHIIHRQNADAEFHVSGIRRNLCETVPLLAMGHSPTLKF
jgi:hypothetical protein